jgi:transcriptional regulator with XRE-family HTH domain
MAVDSIHHAISAEVSALLRTERVRKGLSMTKAAARAGLSQQMVSFVEKGARKPTLDTLMRICDALEVDFVVLLDTAQKNVKKRGA